MMKNEIINRLASDLSPSFKWRDRHGVFHNIKEMETRHLFYTIRMIWNHAVPGHLQLSPFARYYFPDFYSPEYMMDAIRAILIELGTREDTPAEYLAALNWMTEKAKENLRMRIEK